MNKCRDDYFHKSNTPPHARARTEQESSTLAYTPNELSNSNQPAIRGRRKFDYIMNVALVLSQFPRIRKAFGINETYS
jgi:hypothetical protein